MERKQYMASCKSIAAKRYLRRLIVVMLVYMVTVFVTLHILYHGRTSLPAAIGLAAIPSLPLVSLIVVVALYLREEKDEFQRELFIQTLLWGAGLTLALTSFWSFLHLFGHVPPVDGFHVFIIFWFGVGLSSIPINRYYRGGTDE